MATVAETPTTAEPTPAVPVMRPSAPKDRPGPRRLSPSDHGRWMAFEDFILCDFAEGYLYELARGVVVVTEVPGIHHGRIEQRLYDHFAFYDRDHPGLINYRATGSGCRLRLPGMMSDRHPDLTVYLSPPPDDGPKIWTRWTPDLVVEIVSESGEERDFVEKREEYLKAGVREYWILNPKTRFLHVLQRAGDVWHEETVAAEALYRCPLLPGLEVRPADLFGPAGAR